MTLLQLSYFVTLAETLHYTRTSEALHISQPSLSYAISELEKDLGVKLFQKDKQKILLTRYGRQFYPYAKKSIDTLRDGRNVIQAMASETKTVVRWGYFHSVSTTLVPAMISSFQKTPESKGVQFQLIENTVLALLADLKKGNLDFCFTCHEESWATSCPIARQPLYLALQKDHPLARKTTVSFQEFAHLPQIMLVPGSDLRTQVGQLFSENDVIPEIAFETHECNAALQYVALGLGVSILPQVPVMERDSLTIVPIVLESGEELSRTIFLSIHRTRKLSSAAHCVIEHILSSFSGAVQNENRAAAIP